MYKAVQSLSEIFGGIVSPSLEALFDYAEVRRARRDKQRTGRLARKQGCQTLNAQAAVKWNRERLLTH